VRAILSPLGGGWVPPRNASPTCPSNVYPPPPHDTRNPLSLQLLLTGDPRAILMNFSKIQMITNYQ